MKAATMTLNGEVRRFSKEEAAHVHAVMNFVSRYAAESTVWWEAGQGEPLQGSERASVDRKAKPQSPQQRARAKAKPQPQPPSELTGVRLMRISHHE